MRQPSSPKTFSFNYVKIFNQKNPLIKVTQTNLLTLTHPPSHILFRFLQSLTQYLNRCPHLCPPFTRERSITQQTSCCSMSWQRKEVLLAHTAYQLWHLSWICYNGIRYLNTSGCPVLFHLSLRHTLREGEGRWPQTSWGTNLSLQLWVLLVGSDNGYPLHWATTQAKIFQTVNSEIT